MNSKLTWKIIRQPPCVEFTRYTSTQFDTDVITFRLDLGRLNTRITNHIKDGKDVSVEYAARAALVKAIEYET